MRAVPSGPFFGKQNWRCGMNRTWEPRCPSRRSSDPTERCRSLQTAGRWPRKSAPANECVTTHLPKRPALKMEGAQASPPMPRRRAPFPSALRVGGRCGRRGEGPSASRTGTAAGANLGGSSNYSNETLEGRRGRGFRVNGNHTRVSRS